MTREPSPVPSSEADLTPEWFRLVLAGYLPVTNPMLGSMERIGQGYGLSSVLFRGQLLGSSDTRSVIVKLWSTDGPAGTREVLFYASFAQNLGIRVPFCYHGAIDKERKRGVLVLEDLKDVVQGDCLCQLDSGGAAALASTLAALHATWWERPELYAADWLPFIVKREPQWLLSRRELFLRRFGDRVDSTVRQFLEEVEPMQARGNARLVGAPTTLLHADLHLDNVVFEGSHEHPVILDWARVARGPAAYDLAELLFGMTPIDKIEQTLAIYLDGLLQHGATEIDERSLRSQLGGALLLKVITATCGVARWQPSSEREQKMIEVGLLRIALMIEHWKREDPGLFEL
jgi:thiamine kinase-like enzyme